MNTSLRSTTALLALLALTHPTPEGHDHSRSDETRNVEERPLRFSHCCSGGMAHDDTLPRGVDPHDFAPEAKGKARIIEGDIITWKEDVLGDPTSGGPYSAGYGATAWPGGVVPYVFGANTNTSQQNAMRLAMDELETVADVTFIPRTAQANYLEIVDSNGNSSWIGMIGGSQTVNIYNWNYKYIMEHELLHALGFWHEQSRPDRDTYVQINYQNVITQYAYNFDKNPSIQTIGGYDFESIMHYGRTAFTSNGQDTITVLPPNQAMQTVIGNRGYLSTNDAAGLAHIYGAPGGTPSLAVTAPNGGETWNVAQSGTITWTSLNLSPFVEIELSRNGGLHWETLFASTPNDGQETWTDVTGPATQQALIRITDSVNAAEHDESDAFFTIADSRPTITTPLHVTQAKFSFSGPTQDQFKLQAMWNDEGVGLGVEAGTTTLTIRDADTPAQLWTLQLSQGQLEVRGSRWCYKDKVTGVQVAFDPSRKTLSLAAKGQTLPLQSAQTLELLLEAPNFSGTATWPAEPSFRSGRGTPDGSLFFVRKAQIVRGKSPGEDKLRLEGLIHPEGGFTDPRSGIVMLHVGLGYQSSFDASELEARGTKYGYRSSSGVGIVKFEIDAATGAFKLDVRGANLNGLTSVVDLRLEVAQAVGETTLAMIGNPFSKLRFP